MKIEDTGPGDVIRDNLIFWKEYDILRDLEDGGWRAIQSDEFGNTNTGKLSAEYVQNRLNEGKITIYPREVF